MPKPKSWNERETWFKKGNNKKPAGPVPAPQQPAEKLEEIAIVPGLIYTQCKWPQGCKRTPGTNRMCYCPKHYRQHLDNLDRQKKTKRANRNEDVLLAAIIQAHPDYADEGLGPAWHVAHTKAKEVLKEAKEAAKAAKRDKRKEKGEDRRKSRNKKKVEKQVSAIDSMARDGFEIPEQLQNILNDGD